MTDEKSLEMHSHELQKIAHEIISECVSLGEQIQVVMLIDKLPPSGRISKTLLRTKLRNFLWKV